MFPASAPSRRLQRFGWLALLHGGVLVAPALANPPREQLAVNATVMPAYVRPHDAAGKPVALTYAFMPGQFFSGRWVYSTMNRIKFRELLPALATGLAQQNFLPAQDAAAADLIIVVHWGVSDVAEDLVPQQERVTNLNSEFNQLVGGMAKIAPGKVAESTDLTIADAGRINEINREFDLVAADQRLMNASNSVLLGYAATLAKERAHPWPTAEERRMTAELNEGRYFYILMAYERHPVDPDRKGRPIWITRVSVRAPGTNFAEAFPNLVHAGGQVFGRQTDGLVRVQPRELVPTVELGELKMLGTVEHPAAPDPPAEKP